MPGSPVLVVFHADDWVNHRAVVEVRGRGGKCQSGDDGEKESEAHIGSKGFDLLR